jgi:Protein of unknown function (DUF3572)
MDRNGAETIAIEGLSFLAEESERLGRFLALTGISPAQIRAVARDPAFLAGVLDHIAGDESLLLTCAERIGRKPADIADAREILAGRLWERDTA